MFYQSMLKLLKSHMFNMNIFSQAQFLNDISDDCYNWSVTSVCM